MGGDWTSALDPTLLDRETLRTPARVPYSALRGAALEQEFERLRKDAGVVDGIVVNPNETRYRLDAILDRRLELGVG